MAATSSSGKTTLHKLIAALKKDFPSISFTESDTFLWSPEDSTVYVNASSPSQQDRWTLLHEFAHGVLGHEDYASDIELLSLETAAWTEAKRLQRCYDDTNPIDDEHIQDCLDTYRDWLYARSRCPCCEQTGLQINSKRYYCINCSQYWIVTHARFKRPYRMSRSTK